MVMYIHTKKMNKGMPKIPFSTICLLSYELFIILLSLINFHKSNTVIMDFLDTSGTNIASILNVFKSKIASQSHGLWEDRQSIST